MLASMRKIGIGGWGYEEWDRGWGWNGGYSDMREGGDYKGGVSHIKFYV